MQETTNENAKTETPFVPALRFKWATKLYDGVMQYFVREEALRRLTITAMQAKDGEKILDFGCGTGTLTTAIAASHQAILLHGYDIDHEVLTIAKEKALRFDLDAMPSFRRVDITDVVELPKETLKSFDCITSSLVFHHLTGERKQKAFESIRKLMKPGGRLVLVDWGPGSNALLRLAFWSVRMFDGFSVTRDNVQGRLPEMMTTAGFLNVRSTPLLNTFFGTVWLFEADTC